MNRVPPAPALPRALAWISGLVTLVAVVMAVIGALRTGVSWDEPYHVLRLRHFFDDGTFALDWAAGDGSGSNTLVYGPITMLLLHGLGVVTGTEGWDSVSTSPAAYDVRHLGIVLIGLGGTAAAAAITRFLLGSWRWALVTAAALLALPMWTGHLMFNIKDVPVATGYTVMTLALVALASPTGSRARSALRIGALAGGLILMVGTRPGMVAAVAAGLVVLAAGLIVGGASEARKRAIIETLTALALTAAVLVAVYPTLFAHPGRLVDSALQSSSFRNGRDASYGYVPFYVLAQVPLLLLALFAVGTVAALVFAQRSWRTETVRTTRILLVGVQLSALPLYAIVKHSDLYNGLRQVLFAAPAWAVLTTLGLAAVLRWAADRGRLALTTGLAGLALVAPIADQATLFPYQYTYYNPLLDATGIHVPSDYWRTSIPELLDDIPSDGQLICGPTRSTRDGAVAGSVEAEGETLYARRFTSDSGSSVDCQDEETGPLSSLWSAEGRPAVTHTIPDDEFYVIIDRDHPVPPNCTRLASVNRERHFRTVSMTYVARCQQDPSALGSEPVVFTRSTESGAMSPLLWAYVPEGWINRIGTGIVAEQRTATLAFTIDPDLCPSAGECQLVLDADAPDDLIVRVDDRPVTAVRDGDSVNVPLPPGATTAWVTLRRSQPGPLDLRVRSIRLDRLQYSATAERDSR